MKRATFSAAVVGLAVWTNAVMGQGGPPPVKQLGFPETNNAQLTELAAQIVILHSVPGIAIAVVDRTGVRALGVAGVRKTGEPERLQPEDRFHIGSCGKALTATLLARLEARGKLSLGAPIGELLPADFKLDPGYAGLTLNDLLRHRGGIAAGDFEDGQRAFLRVNPDVVAARSQLLERVLGAPPTSTLGKFRYGNLGYIMAANVAERRTGKSFETLLNEEVFAPLGITTGGFGPPAAAGKLDQPWGHSAASLPVAAGPLADDPAAYGPAGTVALSMRDWGKFIAAQLGGGPEGFLTAEQIEGLQRAPANAVGSDTDPTYAAGWGVTTTRGRPTLSHAGSNGMWFSQVLMFPDEPASTSGPGWAILVATNQGGADAEKAITDVLKEIVSLAR